MMKTNLPIHKFWKLYTGAGFLAAAALLQAAARNLPGFGEWYAVTVYPVLVGIIGRFSGVFPFSVVEILLYLCILLVIYDVISHFHQWKELLQRLFLFACILAFSYTANCGINYYRKPFSYYLDLDVRESSAEELRALCAFLTRQVNEAHEALAQEAEPLPATRFQESANDGRLAMYRLSETYPQLAGYYPQAKGLLVSRILSVQQLSGIYSPFTIEANYNREMTGYNIPHTVCHELSHLRGFMREDEANFIGYLACIGWDSPEFRYSGYLTGWIYAGNALAKQDFDTYHQLYGQLHPEVLADLRENSMFWDRFEGKVAEAANQMNDVYLKINSQEDGVKSYGRMVDLLLAYYRSSYQGQAE